MDKQISEKLDALLKYIPFIDFIVEIDKEKYVKFIEIKKWIINKKRYPLSDLNKIEKSLITQYKNLIGLDDKKIPLEIMQIFVNEFKHQYVNLCSDDEDTPKEETTTERSDKLDTAHVNIDSDDDLEIISISYPEKQKLACDSTSTEKKTREESCDMPKESPCIVVNALDETSAKLLRHIDQFSNVESKYADPHNYHEHSDEDEHFFDKSSPILFKRRDEFQQGKGNNNSSDEERKHRCNTTVDTIALDSSDDETFNTATHNDNVRSSVGLLEDMPPNSNSLSAMGDSDTSYNNRMDVDVSAECNLNSVFKEVKHSKVSGKTIPYENQSSADNSKDSCSQGKLISNVNEDKNNENVEKLLLEIIKKLIRPSLGDQSPQQSPTIDKNACNQSTNIALPASPQFMPSVNQHHHQQPIFYPEATLPQSPMYYPYGCNNPAPQNIEANFAPLQVLANQRRLNLKDPRIRNWLNIYKNSPLLTATERDIAATLGNTNPPVSNVNQPFLSRPPVYNPTSGNALSARQCNTTYLPPQPRFQHCRMPHRPQTPIQRTAGSSSTQNRMTYAEYKRRKAEEQERAERQRDEERKRQEDSLKQKVQENIVNDHDIKKKTNEFRSILLNTLQPYSKQMESIEELHRKPSSENTNKNNEANPDKHSGEKNDNILDVGGSKSQPHLGEEKKNSTTNKVSIDLGGEKKTPSTDEVAKSNNQKDTSNGVHVVEGKSNKTNEEEGKRKKSAEENETAKKSIKEKDKPRRGNQLNDAFNGCSIPKAIGVKRRSSVHASSAITEQLNSEQGSMAGIDDGYSQNTRHSSASCAPKRRKTMDDVPKTLLKKRRSSISARAAIAHQLNAKPNENVNKQKEASLPRSFTSTRRKTIDELPSIRNGSELSEKCRLVKNLKPKETIADKQPKLVLKRLTEHEIQNCSKRHEKIKENNKSSNVLNVLLVESVNQPAIKNVAAKKSSASKKATAKRLNNDCQMTESNTRLCALCSSRPSDLTNHYVGKHKTESYISRLTWSQLDELSINTPFAKALPSSNGRVLRYSITCPFCDEELEESFMSLYNHYSTHTGEYAYQCSGCQLNKPFKADIQSHQLHSKICRGCQVQTLYRYPDNTMTIYLHYCSICNFVQLNEANILRHLRDHHDPRQQSQHNVKKCILAAISDGPDTNNDPQQTAAKLNDAENTKVVYQISQDEVKTAIKSEIELNIEDNIPVRNEACSEEPFDSTLCSLEEELKRMHEEPVLKSTLPMTVVHFDSITGNMGSPITPPIFESIHIQCKSEILDEDQCLITPPRPSLQKLTRSPSMPTYRSYPPNVNYMGLYKCMADDCYYSSDLPLELLKHLEDHGRENVSEDYLQCAYCSMLEARNTPPQQLVDHIKEKHLYMTYQCSMCCYRSCEASNVSVHQKESHTHAYQSCAVFKCSGKERLYNKQYISEEIIKNVRKLQCPYCSYKSFYHSNLLEDHIKVDHKIQARENVYYFSCIYCHLTDNDENVIRKHIALKHPQELPYACDHNNFVSENEDLLENLPAYNMAQLVPVTEINVTSDSIAEEEFEGTMEDVKPNVRDLLKCHEETVKCRLRKLTEQRGVAPDILYHCPDQSCGGFFSVFDLWLRHMRVKHTCWECQCPHCPQRTTRPLQDYRVHFEVHRRHTYICFHCSLTFANRELAIQHASSNHLTLGQMRFEQIRYNLSYSYFVMIQREMLTSHSDLILALLNNLEHSLKDMEYNESKNLKHSWLVTNQSWLDDYSADITFRTSFICVACCSHYYSRLQLTNHIGEQHSARDVVIINVIRRGHSIYFGLGVAFANERLSFSTMRNCFCCEERNMKGDSFVLHLKRYHNFCLTYFCEWCNLPIESLQVVEKHFQLDHTGNKLKIRCELASKSDISIASVREFQVCMESGIADEHKTVVVKQEPFDDPKNEESVILLEEDDVVLENYIKEQEKIRINEEKPKLMCIATENLLAPTTNSSAQVFTNHLPLPRIKIVPARHNAAIGYNLTSISTKPGLSNQQVTVPSNTNSTATKMNSFTWQAPMTGNTYEYVPTHSTMSSNPNSSNSSGSVSSMPLSCMQAPLNYSSPTSNPPTPSAIATLRQETPLQQNAISLEVRNRPSPNRKSIKGINNQHTYSSSTIATCFLNSHVVSSQTNANNEVTNAGPNTLNVPSTLNRITHHPTATVCPPTNGFRQ